MDNEPNIGRIRHGQWSICFAFALHPLFFLAVSPSVNNVNGEPCGDEHGSSVVTMTCQNMAYLRPCRRNIESTWPCACLPWGRHWWECSWPEPEGPGGPFDCINNIHQHFFSGWGSVRWLTRKANGLGDCGSPWMIIRQTTIIAANPDAMEIAQTSFFINASLILETVKQKAKTAKE